MNYQAGGIIHGQRKSVNYFYIQMFDHTREGNLKTNVNQLLWTGIKLH